MTRIKCLYLTTLLMVLASWFSTAAQDPPSATSRRLKIVRDQVQDQIDKLEETYRYLHTHPELSLQEVQTANRLAKELESLGFDVTTKIGGTGIVGVLKNGPGPTVLVRTDMDALPVTEKTGVSYASKVQARDRSGTLVGVMHACGHDIHMTCWLGTAKTLVALKSQWSGTLVFIGQPAEEIGVGARAMLQDGLFKRLPKPDYALALHAEARLPVGHINYSPGLALANVDTVDIVVKGNGGHGAAPHTTVDPIVLAARIVLDLQTIVSREINPTDPAVVTVGSIHGGTKHNIIPSDVKLQLTVRTTRDEVRKHVLDAIERIAKAAATGARAPEPSVTVNHDEFTPACVNDTALARKITSMFEEILGKERVHERPPIMGGEDFGRYGREGVPIFMYFLGTIDEARWENSLKPGAKSLPSMHSDSYYPTPEPSIRVGVTTLSMAVLNLVGKEMK
jgi:hippurate hydrolase